MRSSLTTVQRLFLQPVNVTSNLCSHLIVHTLVDVNAKIWLDFIISTNHPPIY